MNDTASLVKSSVGKKVITGITGLALVGFLIGHLIGNLLLFGGSEMFNGYAHFLHTFMHGMFIYIAEGGLILFFGMHIVTGLNIYFGKFSARPDRYAVQGNAKGASKKSLSSMFMAVSGVVILVFVVLHLKHFKYGAMEMTLVHGEQVHDVYRLVIVSFQKIYYVVFYVAAMAIMGIHLKHGVWSALQSLGIATPKTIPCLHKLGMIFGCLLAVGFLILPIIIYFFIPVPPQAVLPAGVHP